MRKKNWTITIIQSCVDFPEGRPGHKCSIQTLQTENGTILLRRSPCMSHLWVIILRQWKLKHLSTTYCRPHNGEVSGRWAAGKVSSCQCWWAMQQPKELHVFHVLVNFDYAPLFAVTESKKEIPCMSKTCPSLLRHYWLCDTDDT